MKIVCISDTHTLHRQVEIPDGDVLIHAGDLCNRGTRGEVKQFSRSFLTGHLICLEGSTWQRSGVASPKTPMF